jgi:glutaredoxin-related protein
MTTQTLTVSSHTRRKPLDPHAEAKARTTALLKEFVALRDMEREIEEIVKEGLRNGD